jgi:replicative DNA helicase
MPREIFTMAEKLHANLDAERRYLSAMATYSDFLLEGGYERLNPQELSLPLHQMILEGIYDCEVRHGRPAEFQTLLDHHLQDTGYLKTTGGIEAFRELLETTTPSLCPKAEALEIHRLAKLRAVKRYGLKALAAVKEAKPEKALAAFQKAVQIAEANTEGNAGTAYDAAWNVAQQIKTGRKNKIAFGIEALDDVIGGVGPGTMTVLGGTTGVGKSSLILFMAMEMAQNGHRPGIVSCEDPEEVWGARLLAYWSYLPSRVVFGADNLDMTQDELVEAMENAEKAIIGRTDTPIHFRYEIGSEASSILGAVHSLARKDNCDIVFVDYIQAIRVDARASRYDKAVSDIAKQLKGTCHRLGVPLILGSQLARNRENPTREPTLFSLKESGDLENEAEVVLLAWNRKKPEGLKAMCRIAKLKWGLSGQVFEIERGSNGMICDVVRAV